MRNVSAQERRVRAALQPFDNEADAMLYEARALEAETEDGSPDLEARVAAAFKVVRAEAFKKVIQAVRASLAEPERESLGPCASCGEPTHAQGSIVGADEQRRHGPCHREWAQTPEAITAAGGTPVSEAPLVEPTPEQVATIAEVIGRAEAREHAEAHEETPGDTEEDDPLDGF